MVFRIDERGVALAFDFGLVMGSSKGARRELSHHLSPAQVNPRQGKIPKRTDAASSCHSNAPIRPESQSFLSKIVALPGTIFERLWSFLTRPGVAFSSC